jgi:hypothetical protein
LDAHAVHGIMNDYEFTAQKGVKLLKIKFKMFVLLFTKFRWAKSETFKYLAPSL